MHSGKANNPGLLPAYVDFAFMEQITLWPDTKVGGFEVDGTGAESTSQIACGGNPFYFIASSDSMATKDASDTAYYAS